MEYGAGKHWTEEEVKALLTVWSEKRVQNYLHGATRNKAMFIYISNRLQEFGVFRDWKQCRAKYKNLKYEYRTVKYAHHNSGELGKSMKFFKELDAILALEIEPRLGEDEDATYTKVFTKNCEEETETHSITEMLNAGVICVALEDDDISTTSDDMTISPMKTKTKISEQGNEKLMQEYAKLSFIPFVAIEGGKHWTDDEVRALLHIWSDSNIQTQLEGAVRNKSIFEEIANKLQKFGIDRDWKQCRTKYKNLKYEYKTVRSALGSGNTCKSMKFFNELDAILQRRTTKQSDKNGDREDISEEETHPVEAEDSYSTASEDPVIKHIKKEPPDIDEDSVSATSEDPVTQNSWKRRKETGEHIQSDKAPNQFRVITVNDTGIGRHWSDDEVRALILIWSDENIRQQLEGATRNKEIFEQISRRLLKMGIDRDWKQCRTKYKNLKYEYRTLQRRNIQICNPKRVMRFYYEVDAILRRSHALQQQKKSEEHCQSADLNTTDRAEKDSRAENCADEDSRGTTEDCITAGTKRKASEVGSPVSAKKRSGTTTFNSHIVTFETVTAYGNQPEEGYCKREEDHQCIPIMHISSETPCQHPQIQVSLIFPHFFIEIKLVKLNEGKTKEIYELLDRPGHVLVQSKDQITAGNTVRRDQMEGKAVISNKTTGCVFKLLQDAGIKTAFVEHHSATAFVAARCEMIPIEWVCRRIATGSFLKRNPGVKEGYRFSPLKLEMFFKDDANNDPQWSEEQLIEAKFCFAGLNIGQCEVDVMNRATVAIFEILEKAWSAQDCTLVDMKIEFGVNITTKEIILADVIDNDSWRLWPSGDRSQQKDKQVYRDLKEVTPEALQMVKRNFQWVAERVQLLLESKNTGRVVVLMGSASDIDHCEKIKKACLSYGIPCFLRVTSAHKGPDETLRIKAEYEGDGVPTVFVAVAGRSNGLGPVVSGNTAYPVINCPPITADWGAQDIWSSLRMPSGLGCTTVLSPDAAAQFAAQIFGLNNHLVWVKLRASMLNTWISLKLADKKLQECTL
ncbi:multifunctional protein ADE2 isoform X1 [Acipenser oxyrinchus oxyrinchus]|uniref:Multifunctional protein ADE2 isoform X1 n=1 Tax=Acipenser oxyrinchus oxyrinchus TaxID=40147 RepID=A0AAD8LV89_ACIOX|nr:multifunctional protein ADE2 isoform X1 [Acipenser oxyrinchus oxyrinchus]